MRAFTSFLSLVPNLKEHRGETVGDFSAQAVVNTILGHAFPGDEIVGEEDAADLRAESGVELRKRVVELANVTLQHELTQGDNAQWGLGPGRSLSADELMDAVDRGTSQGGRTGRACSRFSLLSAVELTACFNM